VVQARDAWIESHGTVVHVDELSSNVGGGTLYYLSSAM
jgi:hypothetical protein